MKITDLRGLLVFGGDGVWVVLNRLPAEEDHAHGAFPRWKILHITNGIGIRPKSTATIINWSPGIDSYDTEDPYPFKGGFYPFEIK